MSQRCDKGVHAGLVNLRREQDAKIGLCYLILLKYACLYSSFCLDFSDTWCLAVFVFQGKMDGKVKKQKQHQQKHSGPKAEKKKLKKHGSSMEEDERKRNPKAFAVQSAVRMAKTFHRLVLLTDQLLWHSNNEGIFQLLVYSYSYSNWLFYFT